MKMIKRVGSRNGVEITKLATAGVLLVSLFVVIADYHATFRVNGYLAAAGIVTAAIVATVIAVATPNPGQRTARVFVFTALIWALLLGFVLPISTPFTIVNPFLVLLGTGYLSRHQLLITILVIILGVEGSFIASESHGFDEFVFLTLHSVSLLLVGLFGTWYQGRLSSVKATDEQISEDANVERERLQSLINSMTDGVVATDTSGTVALYNGAALDILNVNASLDGKNISDYLDVMDKDGNKIPVMDRAITQQGYLVSRDYLLNVGNDEQINLYLSMSPVKVGFGKSGEEGFIMLLRDITREKSLEDERDEFISVVSHELRTPITIAEGNISNALLTAEKEKTHDTIKESLEASHKQVVFLADMINDLATLSRAERGKLQAEPEDIDVHEMVKSLQRDYRTDAQQKGIDFTTHIDREVEVLYSSRLYVREILQNFITNAIKYTQEGVVELNVANKGSRIEFRVKDSGIGISKSDQKHLFKKFFRSEDYRTRENNGTGLGLYVTLKLAKLIKAQINVESVLNEGSTFIMSVPSLERKKPTPKS